MKGKPHCNENTAYTAFSDSPAALSSAQTDRAVLRQALSKAIIEVADSRGARGRPVTRRWTPAHGGVEDSEVADEYARVAAGGIWDAAGRRYLREASLPT